MITSNPATSDVLVLALAFKKGTQRINTLISLTL
jgi:hypothetical protein